MLTGFLIILAMFLVLAGTGPLMVIAFHRFVSQRYRIPGMGDLVLQMMRRSDDEVTSLEVVMKRLYSLLRSFSLKSLKPGTLRIHRIHTITMAPPDYGAVQESVGVAAFCQDHADAYAAVAMKKGWDGSLDEPLEIYLIPDASVRPNHPRLSGTRPASNHQPRMVVPLLPESFSSSPRLLAEQTSEENVARVTVGPAVTRPYGSATTRPYSPDMDQAMTSTAEATGAEGMKKHLPPEVAEESFVPSPSEDDWMRDVAKAPGLFQDGRVVVFLEGRIRVGRGTDCEVFVKDVTVSRSHALLKESHGAWVLVPEDGKPCYVNGELMAGITPLVDGDVLSFAGSPERFEFRA